MGAVYAKGETKFPRERVEDVRRCAEAGLTQMQTAIALDLTLAWVNKHALAAGIVWKHTNNPRPLPPPRHVTTEAAASIAFRALCALAQPVRGRPGPAVPAKGLRPVAWEIE